MARQRLPCRRKGQQLFASEGGTVLVLHDEKKQLRRGLRKQRRALSPIDVHEKSRCIFERLHPCSLFQNATTIVTYAADENEVHTEAMWHAAIEQDTAVYYPRITPDRTNLDFVRRFPNDQLIPGTFGILIPPGNDLLGAGQGRDTVVLTPGVGFDTAGHRLGRGKGYYDRAFGGVLAGAVRVAVAYELQIVSGIPSGPQDERVEWIVTERRLIECQSKETSKTAL